jgi:NADPH:quinone reductase-like Zn-dependent oxidoreductase
MRAVGIRSFGGPEVLEVVELPDPKPGEGEVRVRVAHATVNPADIAIRAGAFRQAMQGREPPFVPGMELAGVVDQVGPGADWSVGDRVMAIVMPAGGRGAQAELVVTPEDSVARAPEGSSLAEAATLPMNGLTVRRALDLLELKPGQTFAVTGAAGAVGGYAVQLGALEGLRVIAVASRADENLVRGLGAQEFVPRGDDAAQHIREVVPEGVDGLLDAAVIGPPILPAVRDGGRLAAVRPFGGESERGIQIDLVGVGAYAHNQEALDELGRLVEQGKLTLRVAETFSPDRAAEAHRRLQAGGVRGRLIIEF